MLSGPPMRQPQMRTGMLEPKLPSVGPLAAFRLEAQAQALGSRHDHRECRNLNARPVGRADKGGSASRHWQAPRHHQAAQAATVGPAAPARGPGLSVTVRPRARRWVRRGPAPCHRRPRAWAEPGLRKFQRLRRNFRRVAVDGPRAWPHAAGSGFACQGAAGTGSPRAARSSWLVELGPTGPRGSYHDAVPPPSS